MFLFFGNIVVKNHISVIFQNTIVRRRFRLAFLASRNRFPLETAGNHCFYFRAIGNEKRSVRARSIKRFQGESGKKGNFRYDYLCQRREFNRRMTYEPRGELLDFSIASAHVLARYVSFILQYSPHQASQTRRTSE